MSLKKSDYVVDRHGIQYVVMKKLEDGQVEVRPLKRNCYGDRVPDWDADAATLKREDLMLRSDLDAVFIGQNFLTPYFVRYGFTATLAYEITHGRSEVDSLYGVTVGDLRTGTIIKDKSTAFGSRAEAEAYVGTLT